MKLVLVKWIDAAHESGWVQGDGVNQSDDLTICATVGWLLYKSKGQIKVCQTLTEGSHAQTLTIPRGMITSIKVIKL